jgi:hypothetical protein
MLISYSYGGPGYGFPPEGGPGHPLKLELVSPGGTRYLIASWPDNVTAPWVMYWSPGGAQAMLATSDSSGVESWQQLTLATGAVRPLPLPRPWYPLGYSTPHGLAIIAETPGGKELARFDLAGHLERRLGPGGGALYTPDGTAFVTGTTGGFRLVSNTGALIRALPVLTTAGASCSTVRWWTAGIVLATCFPGSGHPARFWLVPISGQQPAALTPPSGTPGIDLWQAGSNRYFQCSGASDYPYLLRQSADGKVTVMRVAGSTGAILGTSGTRLLIVTMPSQARSGSLLWYDPVTGAAQWLVQGPADIAGVTGAIPFSGQQNT